MLYINEIFELDGLNGLDQLGNFTYSQIKNFILDKDDDIVMQLQMEKYSVFARANYTIELNIQGHKFSNFGKIELEYNKNKESLVKYLWGHLDVYFVYNDINEDLHDLQIFTLTNSDFTPTNSDQCDKYKLTKLTRFQFAIKNRICLMYNHYRLNPFPILSNEIYSRENNPERNLFVTYEDMRNYILNKQNVIHINMSLFANDNYMALCDERYKSRRIYKIIRINSCAHNCTIKDTDYSHLGYYLYKDLDQNLYCTHFAYNYVDDELYNLVIINDANDVQLQSSIVDKINTLYAESEEDIAK